MEREQEIRIIAYRIWEEEGYGEGNHLEHWLRAEIIWEDLQKSPESEKGPVKISMGDKGSKTAGKK